MNRIAVGTLFLIALVKTASAIECYVCNGTDSTTPFQCSEWFERFDTPDIKPQDCSNVYGAKYCIKHIGRFEALGILCYQCSSAHSMYCSDMLVADEASPFKPEPCDHVFEAEYCVKSTAMHGGIGAKRYCSSRDLGNYCNYVRNPGDKIEYRSCIFTCNSDGCNAGSRLFSTSFLSLLALLVTFLVGLIRN
ncbi:U-scoloptoxin(05)-Sm1a [Malaya genurostris]|uniref:U-scoloptoxin(05)-Sm1a n=1 Tax=Malaya genurostris TaxID=325434 RepID=UPI0026F39B88|nr:U-scoloptoxin(05)-Sm1a [Malaya genurostris]